MRKAMILLFALFLCACFGCNMPSLISGSRTETKTDQKFTAPPVKANISSTTIEYIPATQPARQ